MRDVDLSHLFPLEPFFRRYPWVLLVVVLGFWALGSAIDGVTL